MKRIFTILAAVLLTASVFAQSPEKMSYQAVIRNAENNLVQNTQVGMQISILQGSTFGYSVYVETQTPTTNVNGLASIEIGGENSTVLTGIFSDINWENGPYFIKTETDPAGGSTYTITGTSQLLSVPYALHAKKVETITETDITNLSNLSGTNTGDQDGSETKLAAGINITVTGAGTTASPYMINTTDTLVIGDSYQGGIIFWLDATGQHGLIAATADQSTGIQWYNGTYTTTNAVRDGIGAGMYNTERIIANQGVGSYAAQLCANYQGGGYGDWYLPSKYELNLLYQQKTAVGGFASAYYWSSTETSGASAWGQYFADGTQYYNGKFYAGYVRAVRAF